MTAEGHSDALRETFGALIEPTTRDAAYLALEEAQKRMGDVNDVATLVDRFERYAKDDAEHAALHRKNKH